MAPPPKICENHNEFMPGDEREIDYLICQECQTPCYTFEIEGGRVTEALCTVCGNEDTIRFTLGEVEDQES